MSKAKDAKNLDTSTEERIKEAARKVFMQKGYAATRTRDIAEEAGINLALLNYYFRSKEKLFQEVMSEKFRQLFSVVLPIINKEDLSLEKKLEILVENYIDLLLANQDLPLFVLSEIRVNPERFKEAVQIQKILKDSSLIRQLHEKRPDINPLQFVMSLLGMAIFPFVAKPILFANDSGFNDMMQERKKLVSKWIKIILKAK
ncbi:MAG: TetR/AcrR family transcriptional regulator [Niabella sp.]